MGTSIWQARENGWKLSIKCDRRREGLKSVRPCYGPRPLHLSSLIAALGPDVEIDALQKVLKCPTCGTDRFELQFARPPVSSAGKKDAERPPRKMPPARNDGPSPLTLANTPDRWIIFKCDKCGRRGEYRKESLLEEFDSMIDMPAFLAVFAHARGCGLAVPRPNKFDLARNRDCLIRYDIA